MPDIETPRLVLLSATPDVLRTELESPAALGAMLGVDVSSDWPPAPEYDADAIRYMIALQERDQQALEWGFRYFVLKQPKRLLIGAGGYTAPARDGEIEVGYSISPSARRHGYASEATRALAAQAFAFTDVERVVAHTYPHLAPSIGVLEKCGFRLDGAGKEEGTVRYVLSRAAATTRGPP